MIVNALEKGWLFRFMYDRVLVLGASGFMGRALSKALVNTGRVVLTPTRGDYNLSDQESLVALLHRLKPEAIINLVAISSVVHGNSEEIYQTNAFGHYRLLEAAKSVDFCGPLLLASSANIYGRNPNEKFSETDVPMPLNHYGVSKTMAELYNRFFQDDLDVAAARPFNCIGVGQSEAFVVGKIVAAFARRDLRLDLGNLNVHRDYVDIRDIASMWIAFLDKKERPKIVNFGSGVTLTLSELIEKCTQITGHSITLNALDSLKRPSDILYQCADTNRLASFLPNKPRAIDETLTWMLEQSSMESNK